MLVGRANKSFIRQKDKLHIMRCWYIFDDAKQIISHYVKEYFLTCLNHIKGGKFDYGFMLPNGVSFLSGT